MKTLGSVLVKNGASAKIKMMLVALVGTIAPQPIMSIYSRFPIMPYDCIIVGAGMRPPFPETLLVIPTSLEHKQGARH